MDFWDQIEASQGMDLDRFWGWIESSRATARAEGLDHHEALGQMLSLEGVELVADFQKRFRMLSDAADRTDVHKVLGGSDDGFHYKLSALISMGRQAYEQVMAKPRSFRDEMRGYELFEYAGHNAGAEPTRGELQSQALARMEADMLEESIAHPAKSHAAPRI